MGAKNEFGLTSQQEVFAQAVGQGLSLADAYRKAYPRSVSWALNAVYAQASELAADNKVSIRISDLRSSAADANEVTTERLVRSMACIAFSDIRKLFDADGKLKSLADLDDDTAAAIASYKVKDGGVEVKLWDKGAAQEKLAKFLGMYEKDNRQKTDPLRDLAQALLGNVVGPGGVDLGAE